MLTADKLEKIIDLENDLRSEYQTQLDCKSAEIESHIAKQEEQQAIIVKQLEQLTSLSTGATANKRLEQINRELENRCEKMEEEMASQKKRIKELQKNLAEERAELKTLKKYDPAAMKKNLDASKKKLAERTNANDLLQKSVNKTKTENVQLQGQVKELEAKLALLEVKDEAVESEAVESEAAAA